MSLNDRIDVGINKLRQLAGKHPRHMSNVRVKFDDVEAVLLAMKEPEAKQFSGYSTKDKLFIENRELEKDKRDLMSHLDSLSNEMRFVPLDEVEIAKIVRVYSGWDIVEESCFRISKAICAKFGTPKPVTKDFPTNS